MSVIPLIFTSGWASGINAYAVALLLGLYGRYGHVAAVPPTLERTDVLAVVGALFLVEFVVDKVAYLDSTWDAVHTVVRPIVGGAIGYLIAHHAHGSLPAAVAAAVGGATALSSHAVKAGVRLGVNTSPEPASNVLVSLTENVVVAGIVSLAVLHPLPAAIIAATLLVVGLTALVFLASRIRRYWRRGRERARQRRPGPAPGTTG